MSIIEESASVSRSKYSSKTEDFQIAHKSSKDLCELSLFFFNGGQFEGF